MVSVTEILFPHSNTHSRQHTEQHGCSRQLSEQFGLSLETAVCPHLFTAFVFLYFVYRIDFESDGPRAGELLQ